MIKKKIPAHYVDNAALQKALIEWKKQCVLATKTGKEWPRPSDYIGSCILKICSELSSRYNFVLYSYKDEMVSDGIESCINAIKNFNPRKGKAFDYLTMVAFRAFQRRILIERKQQYVKSKNFVYTYTLANLNGQIHEGGIDNEYTNKVIDEYESKHLTSEPKKPKVMHRKLIRGRNV
jgi:hypothetical protein